MPRPTTRSELLDATEAEYHSLLGIVTSVPEDLRELPGACDDWSVKDLLAHLDAWHEMFLMWDAVGLAGGTPAMPAPGYTWAQIPALNQEIYERHKRDPWDQVVSRLERSFTRVDEVIASYSNDDLFTKKRYPWTGSTSVGSYATSATSSHYAWAHKLIRRWLKNQPTHCE
jgi:hypothetical protein